MHPSTEFTELIRLSTGSEALTRSVVQATSTFKALEKGEHLIHADARPQALFILARGVVQAYRRVPSGSKQTLALYVPGDMLDPKAFILGRSSVSLCAITPILIAPIAKDRFERLTQESPTLVRWLTTRMALDHTVLEEWTIGMGRRPALQRLAHLVCEISARMQAAGMGDDASCAFPLTQSDIADVLGLSVVHVNRVLQRLRSSKLIELQSGRLKLLDRARLVTLADFEPDYLYLGVGKGANGA
jgi:CRP-like cAMP-binding protein